MNPQLIRVLSFYLYSEYKKAEKLGLLCDQTDLIKHTCNGCKQT